MKITVVAVGRLKEKFYEQAVAEYAKRLSRYCRLEIVQVADEKTPYGASEAVERQIKEKEGKRILAQIRDGAYVIALAIQGEMVTSEELAATLERGYLRAPKVQFVIGGSRGVTDEVRARADAVVAFGRMTFPHRLMRLIAAEQLYRAFTISENVQYHK